MFDSGPQVIESIFANSIDIAYVGPGPAINGFLKSEKQDVKILGTMDKIRKRLSSAYKDAMKAGGKGVTYGRNIS